MNNKPKIEIRKEEVSIDGKLEKRQFLFSKDGSFKFLFNEEDIEPIKEAFNSLSHNNSVEEKDERCNFPLSQYTFCLNHKPCKEHGEIYNELKKKFSPSVEKPEWEEEFDRNYEPLGSDENDSRKFGAPSPLSLKRFIYHTRSQAVEEYKVGLREEIGNLGPATWNESDNRMKNIFLRLLK